MKKQAANARKTRLEATQRLIKIEESAPDQVLPNTQHRAKRRYMVEPQEIQAKVAHA